MQCISYESNHIKSGKVEAQRYQFTKIRGDKIVLAEILCKADFTRYKTGALVFMDY